MSIRTNQVAGQDSALWEMAGQLHGAYIVLGGVALAIVAAGLFTMARGRAIPSVVDWVAWPLFGIGALGCIAGIVQIAGLVRWL
ncbi:hypothetical protein HF319_05980 [Xanthomonas sp. Kuri4-1]